MTGVDPSSEDAPTGPVGIDREGALDELLATVVGVAVDGLPTVSGASVSLVSAGSPRYGTAQARPVGIKAVDEAQYTGSGGPAVEAIERGVEVRVEIPAERWSHFSEVAEQAALRSVWSLPLRVGDNTAGTLNLYSADRSPWDTPISGAARLLARQTTVHLAHAAALAESEQLNVTLRRALETRTVIGQAQGVLMARQGTTPDQAFDVLRRASQRTNRKLRDVAAEIVAGVRQGAG